MDKIKLCPFCAETIKEAAVVCRYCGRELSEKAAPAKAPVSPELKRTNDSAAFGLLPLILILGGCPTTMLLFDSPLAAMFVAAVGVAMLAYGVVTGKVRLFG